MNNLRRLTLAAVLIVALVAGNLPVSAQSGGTPADICAAATEDLKEPESREFEQAEDVLQEGADYWALICTESGAIYLDLFEDRSADHGQ